MKVIIPRTTNLIASNITEDLALWSTAVTYNAGNRAYVLLSDFPELVTYGDCFFDTFLKDGAEWTFSATNTRYDCDGSQIGTSKLYQAVPASKVVAGDQFLIQFEVAAFTVGVVAGYAAGVAGANVGAVGYYQQLVVAGSANAFVGVVVDSTFVGSITNISVKKAGVHCQRDIYESQTTQSGNFPPIDDYTNWIRRSASIRWRMFDDYTNTQSEKLEDVHVKVDSTKCNSLAVLGVEGTAVRVVLSENSTNYMGVSSTSVEMGLGAKSFMASTGKLWAVGDLVEIENTADILKFMVGAVTAYDSATGALDVLVDTAEGTGTLSAWTIHYCWQNESYPLLLSRSSSWSDYFYTEIRFMASIVKTFPVSFNSSCRVFISGGTSQVIRCGHCLVGMSQYLGISKASIRSGITDYSFKETNAYGETRLSQGAYSKDMSFDFKVPAGGIDRVNDTLTQLRAIPCVWDANNGTGVSTLVTYGTYEDFTELIERLDYTIVSLNIKGLT